MALTSIIQSAFLVYGGTTLLISIGVPKLKALNDSHLKWETIRKTNQCIPPVTHAYSIPFALCSLVGNLNQIK